MSLTPRWRPTGNNPRRKPSLGRTAQSRVILAGLAGSHPMQEATVGTLPVRLGNEDRRSAISSAAGEPVHAEVLDRRRTCNAICNRRGKAGCERSDPLKHAQAALQRLRSSCCARGDRRDPLGQRHPATDQKVGGSNPSERAKSAGHGLRRQAYGQKRRNLQQLVTGGDQHLKRSEASARWVPPVLAPSAVFSVVTS
jgi:hypothetical protein